MAAEERGVSSLGYMAKSTSMDKDQSQVAERVLNLTLEIVYLLTEEVSITTAPLRSLTAKRKENILNATKVIIQLLTGEAPMRCEDVSFSMEDLLPLTSPDGSSTRRPKKRPHPVLSRESTWEDHTIPHQDQGEELEDIKIKEEEEERLVSGDQQSMEEGEMIMKSKQDSSLLIDTSGCYAWNISEGHLIPSPKNPKESSAVHEGAPTTGRRVDRPLSFPTRRKPFPKNLAGGRSFSCTECGKGFVEKADLYVHQRVHTGERPFACLDCGRCFAIKHHLISHQRVHTGERPFSCPDCGRCFSQRSNLRRHQRGHAGMRPYICLTCGQSFTDNRNLLNHQIKHQPFPCLHCGKLFVRIKELLKHQEVHAEELTL
ncbi:oocyte zinc finger protein XlCOF8.4-like isoform X2 [Lithobates pipiens]